MKKPTLYALLAVIILCQFCFMAGFAVAFDMWPAIKSSAYMLLHGQVVDNPEELVVVQDVFGRYGHMDNKGIVRIWPRFQLAGEFHENLASVTAGKIEGYINAAGKIVIPPQFDSAGIFSDGLAIVAVGGKKGVIDTTGQFVIKPEYAEISDFQNGIAAVWTTPLDSDHEDAERLVAIIDRSGALLYHTWYSNVYTEAYSSMLLVRHGRKYGYIDAKTGSELIKPRFKLADGFIDGKAFVQDVKTGLWGVIDTQGSLAAPYSFSEFKRFSDGMAAVKDPVTEKWGFINRDGDLVIPYQYADGSDWLDTPDMLFIDGVACVAVNDEDYVIIDKSGKTVIDAFPQYHEISKDSMLYDGSMRDGEPYPDFLNNYGYAGEGLHWVEKEPGELTFFDRSGTAKFRVEGQTAGNFADGLCPVKRNELSRYYPSGEVGYIDLSGRLVIGFKHIYGSDFCNGVAAVSDAPYRNLGYINTAGQLIWLSTDFKISAVKFTLIALLLIPFFAYILVKFSQQEREPVFLLHTPYVKHWKVQNQENFPYLMAIGRKRSFACMIKHPFRRHWRLANQADILSLQQHLDQKTLIWIMKFNKRAHWRTASPLLFQARAELRARNDVSYR